MEPTVFEIAWSGLLHWLDVPEENARQMRSEVLANYRQPERAYHNLGHALRVLRDVKMFSHAWGVEDYGAVQLAALLHDVIYDTRSKENEAHSAEFVMHWGQLLGVAPVTCQRTAEIILATRDHSPTTWIDAALVLDADMAILASPWNEYDVYRHAIRREYSWVTEADWTEGRGRVLAGFLEQEPIYQMPALRDRLEEAAQENIERELSLL
ncbi:MAG: HD domain-containing protein [Janthinobacterium lividum]